MAREESGRSRELVSINRERRREQRGQNSQQGAMIKIRILRFTVIEVS